MQFGFPGELRGSLSMIQKIIKRDGREAEFHREKIVNAIYQAAQALGGTDHSQSEHVADLVIDYLENTMHLESPTVEQVQDVVEKILNENSHARTPKEFILYRAERTRIREMNTR